MIKIALAFLSLVLLSFPTIARQNCPGKVIPWTASIAGSTDSITVEAILAAGKTGCTNKAFEIISFVLSFGGDCLTEGMYTEVLCESASFSTQAVALIKSLSPGKHLYLDCIRVRNKVGQEFLLKTLKLKICANVQER